MFRHYISWTTFDVCNLAPYFIFVIVLYFKIVLDKRGSTYTLLLPLVFCVSYHALHALLHALPLGELPM